MKILFSASEIYPYAKSGGLADVADAFVDILSKYQNIERVMPFYSFMDKKGLKSYANFTINLSNIDYEIEVLSEINNKIVTYFINAPLLSTTKNIYGDNGEDYTNNDLRFAIFSKAIVRLAVLLKVDILHLNDWHTALASFFIKDKGLDIKTVLTIHNLAYQGIFTKNSLDIVGIGHKYFTKNGLEFYGKVNFLKAGIAYSDIITTVSPNYAKEILTKEFGCGLDGFLNYHKSKLFGILNGINESVFKASTDKSLYANYDEKTLKNKHKNKVEFIKKSTLKDPRILLFIMITRLVEQKGMELLIESLNDLLVKRINLFLIGEGSVEICEKLHNLSAKYSNFEFFEGYDESLSHKTYASADFLLMPSSFEPCGLNQFIAMKYATMPIVHAVGGLKDSVHEDVNSCGVGIVYEKQTKKEFLLAIDRALKLKKNSKKFNNMLIQNMKCDFSFKASSQEYIKLYTQLLKV